MKNICSVISVLFLCVSSFAANPTVITLNNIPLDFRYEDLPSYTEGNFTISASCSNCSNVFSTIELNPSLGTSNEPISSDAAGWGASGRFLETWDTSVVFTLTENSGNLFDFLSLDYGWYNDSTSNADWNIKAYGEVGVLLDSQNLFGNGTALFNWQDLSSVQLQNNGGASSFDNIVVSAVPEPSILALMGLGIFGLGLSRRKMKK
jgi:hypothetical protein